MSEQSTKAPTAHKVTVIVNTRPYDVDKDEITFEHVVSLAFGEAPGGETVAYTVSYRRGRSNKPTGALVEGANVKVKAGMIFNVTKTDKS